jgi:hypothetical protein
MSKATELLSWNTMLLLLLHARPFKLRQGMKQTGLEFSSLF